MSIFTIILIVLVHIIISCITLFLYSYLSKINPAEFPKALAFCWFIPIVNLPFLLFLLMFSLMPIPSSVEEQIENYFKNKTHD